MCLWNPGTELVSRWRFDTSTHLVVTSEKTQHEEDRMRDIHVGKRGPEAAGEEQPDKLRKTVRFEQEAPSAAASSDSTVALENPASGETQDRPGSVFVQKSGHVDDDVQISALDAFYEMDGRKSRYIGEVLEWYRGEDAGDLKRSELNELVESLTCLNALEGKIWKINPKILMDEELVQNIVMDEELVQNIVMNEELVQNSVMNDELVQNGVTNEKFVKNFVMNGKIDPKVSIFLNWWMEQFATHKSIFVGRFFLMRMNRGC